MAKKVDLGNGRIWATQKSAKEHFKEILSRYKNGETVSDAKDHADLVALIASYDRGVDLEAQKAGVGILNFFRGTDVEHFGLNDCFFVRRLDGSVIDFSFHKAVTFASRN